MFLLPSDRKIESQRASSPGSSDSITTRHGLQWPPAWGRPLQLIQTPMDRLLWTWTQVGKMHGLIHPHQDCQQLQQAAMQQSCHDFIPFQDERFQFHPWRSACGRKMKEACLFSGTMSFWQSSTSRLMLAPWPTMSAEPFWKSHQRIKFSATPARSVGSLRKLLSADFYGPLVDLGLQLLWRIGYRPHIWPYRSLTFDPTPQESRASSIEKNQVKYWFFFVFSSGDWILQNIDFFKWKAQKNDWIFYWKKEKSIEFSLEFSIEFAWLDKSSKIQQNEGCFLI